MFCNNGVLRNFARIHRKTPVPEPLLKKRLWRRCFSVNFAKFLRHLFLQNNSGGCFWIRGMTVTRWVWTNSDNSWNVISGYLYWNKVLIYPVILLFGRFIFLYLSISSHRRCSVRKGVIRNFARIHRKTPVPEPLLKKRLWHRCFPVNFAKFLRAPVSTEQLRWLLLNKGNDSNKVSVD